MPFHSIRRFPVLVITHIMCLLFGHAFCVYAESPNIVLILSDDQGWADIGYNNPDVYSPNLDQLASTGIVFTQHYVMPQCTPTRVALLTGRYPSRFGGAALQASNAQAFPKGTPTLASILKASGYETFLAGKWHLGSMPSHGPNEFGFDSSYGSLAGAVGMYDHRYRKGDFEYNWHRDQELINGSENGVHATELVTAEAIRVIRQERSKPFFLYLPFHSVHTPLDERGRFVDQPTALDPANPNRWLNEEDIPWFNDPAGKIQNEKDPEKRLLLAAVHHLDDCIGRIIKTLDETDQRQNTLILFSSDNGPQGNWPGNAYPDDLKLTDFNQPLPFRGKKLDVWEGGIHVPGLMNWPGKIKPRQETTPTHIVDWLPTLAAIGKSNSAGSLNTDDLQLDGIDLSKLIFDNEASPKRVLYWTWNSRINRWALRYDHWKLVKYGRGEPTSKSDWELFDLHRDPKESNDVSDQYSDIVDDLHRRFLAQRSHDKK
ncbi:sulfatase-like hydrolase/transferase [Stieleria sp. JC731]|nr:sulfatase-like hydrolase/transferase [Stieleria sp. JC731]MCC9601810.1 sulfatase-like hydrolase/transferase [Stieleria sp. JC731]